MDGGKRIRLAAPSASAVGGGGLALWASIGFVPLWSSGIVFGALALRYGPPFAVTGLRFAAATLLAIAFGIAAVRPLMTERR